MIGTVPDGWRVEKLGSNFIAKIIMGQSPTSSSYNSNKDGLPFYQGKKDFGKKYPIAKEYSNAPKKIALKDDILFCVRAPVGITNIATEKCCIGRGLSAIRTNNLNCLNDFLRYFFIRNEKRISDRGRGSTFLSINKKDLEELEIPIPPLQQQKKIVKVLDTSSLLIEKQKELLQQYDLFLKAKFIEMFGDPIKNPMGWEIVKLNKYGSLARGKSAHRPRNAPFLYGGKYPFIQTGDITKGNSIYLKNYKQTYSEDGIKQSKLFPKDTIAITIAANIGDTKILSFDCYFPDSVVGFNVENPLFVSSLFSYYKSKLEQQATKTAQKNINLQVLNNLDVLFPPITLQNKFALIVEKIEIIKAKESEKLKYYEILHKGLMDKAFKGEIK